MIIDDKRRAAFVHVPKCGGTSVRGQLASVDCANGFFYGQKTHEVMGVVHYNHLPLVFLRRHFPAEFAKLALYRTFALVRDPHERFASATFQWLDEVQGRRRVNITGALARTAAREVMGWLSGRATFYDREFIHFSRQVDFVDLDGQRIADSVYALEHLSEAASAFSTAFGVAFDPEKRENTNFASGGGLLPALQVLKPVYSRLTPWAFRERILLLMRRWKIQDPAALYGEFRQDLDISGFVDKHYAADIGLHHAALARPVDPTPSLAVPGPSGSGDR